MCGQPLFANLAYFRGQLPTYESQSDTKIDPYDIGEVDTGKIFCFCTLDKFPFCCQCKS